MMHSAFRFLIKRGREQLLLKKASQFKNIENLKWVGSWMKHGTPETHLDSLKDCTSKLDNALAHRPNDHKPWSKLGSSYYHMLPNGRCHKFLLFSHNTCVKHPTPGIASFRAPGIASFRSPRICPFKDDLYPDTEEEDEDVWVEEWADSQDAVWDRADDEALDFLNAQKLIYRRESTIFPNDARVLKTLGITLLELAYYHMGDSKRALLSEAVDKLEKSLELNPEDKRTKLELLCGQLRLRIPKRDGDEEYVRLVKEYKTLSEELEIADVRQADDREAMWRRVAG